MFADRLANRTVLITGASSGIGLACAQQFAQAGARLIVAARRLQRLQQLTPQLQQAGASQVHCLALDVCDRTAVSQAIANLPQAWQTIDVLVNNAGLSRGLDKQQEADIQDWEEMIDTNIKGLLYVTRAVVPSMIKRQQGHVINIGSVAGRQTYPGGSVYCASKAAVKALSEGLKIDLLGTPLRVTNIEPGLVETEFSQVRFHGDTDRAAGVYQGMTPLTADDVADAVLYAATRPAHVNISEIFLLPTDQSSATLVHRR